MDDIAPAVAGGTAMRPVLNGMRHLDLPTARVGAEGVLGGLAQIPATRGPEGQVARRRGPDHQRIFGELPGGISARAGAILAVFNGAKCLPRQRPDPSGDAIMSLFGECGPSPEPPVTSPAPPSSSPSWAC